MTATDVASQVGGSLPSVTRRIKRLGWKSPASGIAATAPVEPAVASAPAPFALPAPEGAPSPVAVPDGGGIDVRALAISASIRVILAAENTLQAGGALGAVALRSLAAALGKATENLSALGVLEAVPPSLPELKISVMTAKEEAETQRLAEFAGEDDALGEDVDDPDSAVLTSEGAGDEQGEARPRALDGAGRSPVAELPPVRLYDEAALDGLGTIMLRQMAAEAGIDPVPRDRAALIAALR